jgi:2,5-diketo-D-gluconate reductase B
MQTVMAGAMRLPRLGLGTWRLRGRECTEAVLSALELGYRHIDTAEAYGNEEAVGEALAGTSVPRREFVVTTKVWWDHLTPDAMRRALEGSLGRLHTPYVDLYLIHWPAPDMNLAAALHQMMAFREQGLVRHIGVANFPMTLLRQAVEEIGAPIVCNQVECHVNLGQSRVLGYLRSKGMALVAYRPLGGGRFADAAALRGIADAHGATPAQVALAWLLHQDGVAAIPKAAGRARQQANLAAADLALDAEDLAALAALPKGDRHVSPGWAPAWDPPG